jgi:DNA polymerase
MVDAAPADELRELAHLLRIQLRRHRALGAWAAPGGPTAAYVGAAAETDADADADAATEADLAAAQAPDAAADGAVENAADAASAASAADAASEAEVAGAADVARARDVVVDADVAAVAGKRVATGTTAHAVEAGRAEAGRADDRMSGATGALEHTTAAGRGDVADAMAAFDAAMGEATRFDDAGGPARFFDDARVPARVDDARVPARVDDGRASVRELFPAPESAELVPLGRRTLAQVREELGECTRCKLHTTRRKIVFGVGAEDTPLMFVGEAPGEQEDKRGEPFVGPAGELLDKMIEAMGWSRDTVYIANTTKCRPPGNRNPQPDELAQCTPFLDAQIRAISPRIIVTLGRPAANHVLRKDAPISSLRGRFHDRGGVKVMPTFHPAYLLRDPDKKKDTWSDLKQVIAELERLGIKSPRPSRG